MDFDIQSMIDGLSTAQIVAAWIFASLLIAAASAIGALVILHEVFLKDEVFFHDLIVFLKFVWKTAGLTATFTLVVLSSHLFVADDAFDTYLGLLKYTIPVMVLASLGRYIVLRVREAVRELESTKIPKRGPWF